MKLTTKLTRFVLNQTLSNWGGQVLTGLGNQSVNWLEQHYTDPSQALPKAIDQANTRTWRVLELALAGDSFTAWLQQRFISGAERGLLDPLRTWLKGQGEGFRKSCLAQLRAARADGLLIPDHTGKELINFWGVAGITSQGMVVADAKALMTELSQDLQTTYPQLALFLTGPDANLLPEAFSYFLQQAIVNQPTLREALNFQRLDQVWHEQAQGFAALEQLLAEQGTAIAAELERIDAGLEELAQGQAIIEELVREALDRLPVNARQGGVPPRLSSILRSASDQRLFAELEQRVNELPAMARTSELLDAIGRLAMAVGLFDKAGQRFQQSAVAAHRQGSTAIEAEAHYNVYRALLEQKQFDAALTELLTAARLDAENFAPFPLDKYVPQRILGAGGFGVAFLCHHIHLNDAIVIKSLFSEELGRDMEEIFREGRILWQLRHPSIIGISDCDYAGVNKQRPYLVMEYFNGSSLSKYLEQHGVLTLEQTIALAQDIAQALQAAHQQNILHRDIKPDNLMVHWDGTSWQIKLIDFGLAVAGQRVLKTIATGLANQSILGNSLGGTFQYSAPEQLGTIAGKIGAWSDVYAFGKTLSYALFKTTQPSQKNYRTLGGHLFADLLSDCMEQTPGDRLQDFSAVITAFEQMDRPTQQVLQAQRTQQPSSSNQGVLDQKIIQWIKDRVALDYPSDQSMQLVIIQREVAAWNQFKLTIPIDIPEAILRHVLSSVYEDHPEDFTEQLFIAKKQVEAWKELQEYKLDGVPDYIIQSISNKAKEQHSGDFATRLLEVKKQANAWKELQNYKPDFDVPELLMKQILASYKHDKDFVKQLEEVDKCVSRWLGAENYKPNDIPENIFHEIKNMIMGKYLIGWKGTTFTREKLEQEVSVWKKLQQYTRTGVPRDVLQEIKDKAAAEKRTYEDQLDMVNTLVDKYISSKKKQSGL